MTDWASIISALHAAGADGGKQLSQQWEEATTDAQRCVIAHYLADQQASLDDEVAWDERALAAYGTLTQDELTPVGIADARGMEPSLHLNLADGYHRQGRLEDARHHLALAQAESHRLGADAYGDLVRQGISALQDRLES